MAPSPYERTLRTIAMVAAAPGFILTLAGGICISRMNWWNHYNIATPYFAMIPLFLTVATGAVHRRGNSSPDSSSEIINALRTTFWLMADLCLALGYLAVLLPIWIIEPGRLRGYRSGGPLIVVVYGTCFLLTNMFIHGYLFLYRARTSRLFDGFTPKRECPNCGETMVHTTRTMSTKKVDSGPRYNLLGDHAYSDDPEEEVAGPSVPRPSMAESKEPEEV